MLDSTTSIARPPSLESFGGRLRHVRRRHGDAQSDLAAHLGITRASVAMWESNKARPTAAHVRSIAQRYRVSIQWLRWGCGLAPRLPQRNWRRRLPTPAPLPVISLSNAADWWSRSTDDERAAFGRSVDVNAIWDGAIAPNL
jgi:transcriptional regulator with XRE-family HTH domain